MSEVCTNTYVQDLGNQYEKVSDYIAFLFEQYAPYMWYVLLGTTGVWSAVMGVMIIVANKNEDKHKARRIGCKLRYRVSNNFVYNCCLPVFS